MTPTRRQPPSPATTIDDQAAYRVAFGAPAVPRRAAPARKGPAAILIAHGMGQQIPFQTLDDVAEGLRRQDQRRRRTAELPPPVANTVSLGDQRLQRLELKLGTSDGGERDVHIYEAYWAPFTEGRVTLRDVVAFLLRGGIGGVLSGWRPFRRWMFGEYVHFAAPVRTVLYLITALAVVLALAFLNILIVAVGIARAPLSDVPRWLSNAFFSDVTTVLNGLVTVIAAFALALAAAKYVRRPAVVQRVVAALSVVAFVAAIWATIVAALFAAAVAAFHVGSPEGARASLFDRLGWAAAATSFDDTVDRWLVRLLVVCIGAALLWWTVNVVRELVANIGRPVGSPQLTVATFAVFAILFGSLGWIVSRLVGGALTSENVWAGRWRHGVAWPLVVLTAALVRRFLIQYAGDVAAYVQPHVLDRFYQVRQKIKDSVWRTAHAVYGAREYDDVIMVGHSLGSVVVYDVLNRLLLDEALAAPGAPEVASRTRLLLTFGSPLDKTAFIFGAQGNRSEAREALAASVQPLITEDDVRPRWINLYSRWDIISGSLDYYDLPDKTNTNPVENQIDPDATTLLAAHVEYWTSPRLFEVLAEHLV